MAANSFRTIYINDEDDGMGQIQIMWNNLFDETEVAQTCVSTCRRKGSQKVQVLCFKNR